MRCLCCGDGGGQVYAEGDVGDERGAGEVGEGGDTAIMEITWG